MNRPSTKIDTAVESFVSPINRTECKEVLYRAPSKGVLHPALNSRMVRF